MSINLAILISLTANMTLCIFSCALAFLVVWQDAHRRSNQYFALCVGIFAIYGVINAALTVAPFFNLAPEPLLYLLTTLYIVGITLIFGFVLAFAGLPRYLRCTGRLFSIPVGLMYILLTWGGAIYEDFTLRPSGRYDYNFSTIGMFGMVLAILYLAVTVAVLYRWRSPHARPLSLAVGMFALGVIGFAIVPAMRVYAFNSVAMTAAVVMLGRLVIKYQVFQPLADLNAEFVLKNAELLEATERKGQFLANMSHELRTPLNSIIGYTELIVKGTYGDLTELQRDRLQKVINNGRFLLRLINDVLDISRIEAGRMALNIKRISTTALLDDLFQTYAPLAAERNLSLVRGYGRLPDMMVDQARARQILDNLLSNAVTFTERGVIIMRGCFDDTRQQVVLSVTDTGPGIELAQQERIDRAFRQLDGSLKQRHDGTGLGLAIAHRLASIHGGNLWFESTAGQGSTFYVALPATGDAPRQTVVQPARRASGPIVLVIDGDRHTIKTIQAQLARTQFRIYGACDAGTGLHLARELHPALIALDPALPDMPGEQVLDTLRHDPVTTNTPVVIISASETQGCEGLDTTGGFLTKPVAPDALIAVVRRLALGATRFEEGG